jgi:ElaB/YqjD/DUF883 family membrane-anchored ribosome-binding protein
LVLAKNRKDLRVTDSRIHPEDAGKSSEEVDAFLEELATGQHSGSASSLSAADNTDPAERRLAADGGEKTTSSNFGDINAKGQEALSTAKGKAAEMTSQATAKAGEGIDKATEMLRQRGEQTGGTVGAAATTAADTLESASSYVRSRDRDQMVQDIESFIRERPVESILIAAGAGFILAKIMS